MSTTSSAFGALDQPTSPKWRQTPENKTIRPYRVKYGDAIYSQADFLQDDHRYYNFTSGVGAGKTVAGILRVAANVEQWNPGEMGMIITPTSLGLKNVIMPELSKWNFLNSWEYKGPQSEAPGLHAPNGSRILLESADNDRKIERLRGPSISWFWMDEAALVPKKAWNILLGRLRTGNYRNAFITTTPKGYNWVYEKFVQEETRVDDVENVLGVPSFANPNLPLDYRREILGEYEGQFRAQEVLGEFVEFEGLVYPWFSDAHQVDPPSLEDLNVDQVFYGVDWGFRGPSVILAIVATRTGEYYVVEEFYENRVTVNDLVRIAEDMQSRWRPGPFYCDPAEPASVEEFRRAGLDAVEAENEVLPGIQHVTSLESDLRVATSCQQLINEFGMYRYEDDDEAESEKPVKVNDHAMDALRYSLHTHDTQGGLSVGVVGGDMY